MNALADAAEQLTGRRTGVSDGQVIDGPRQPLDGLVSHVAGLCAAAELKRGYLVVGALVPDDARMATSARRGGELSQGTVGAERGVQVGGQLR